MSRCRAIVVVLSLALALPSAAFAQGAGDEQYQDPFGDDQTQQDRPRAAQDDDGLSPAPPVDEPDDGGDTTPPEQPPRDPAPEPDDERALPDTGSDPRILAFVGVLLLLVGAGLRLRTIDPDAY
jgi:LPXTG-motif cell wall-anchored protein